MVDEVEGGDVGYLNASLAAPSTIFPVFEPYNESEIRVYPSSIVNNIVCRYIRKPLDPKWTYTVVGGVELFDDTAADFQDFELHVSELSNIVVRMLSYFGINLREGDVVQYAEQQKQINEVKEQQQ